MVSPEAETYLGNQGRAYPALISTQNSWHPKAAFRKEGL
jgi:hypothetical protein